jgi:hypothetical protein
MGNPQPKPGQTWCEWQRDLIPEGEDCGSGYNSCPWYDKNKNKCILFGEDTNGSKTKTCIKNKYLIKYDCDII